MCFSAVENTTHRMTLTIHIDSTETKEIMTDLDQCMQMNHDHEFRRCHSGLVKVEGGNKNIFLQSLTGAKTSLRF